MILTCPACATRYSVDGARFPAEGRTVRCSKCAHSWHQPGEEPQVQDQPAGQSADEPAAPRMSRPAPDPGPEPVPAAESASGLRTAPLPTRRFVPHPAAPAPQQRGQFWPRLAVVAGWLGLIAAVVLIAVSAVRYRQDIAVIWPQSAGVYAGLGLAVNASGIDFRQVNYKRESEDGQMVLAVTGVIVNTGTRELPVPQTVRVTLSDANNNELYHWTFKPDATMLKPGQSAPFVTRLSSPPATARHLEVRFAKDAS